MTNDIQVRGNHMHVETTSRLLVIASPFCVVLGVAMVIFAYRGAQGEAIWAMGLMGPAVVAAGIYFAFWRRGLILDKEAKRVTAWWKWLSLRGERFIDAGGKSFLVERFTRRSDDSGTTDHFRILLGHDLLHVVSESQGGKERAAELAERMASHLGLDYRGVRDCKEMARRDALAAKYALAPLLVVGVCMFAAVVMFLVTARR